MLKSHDHKYNYSLSCYTNLLFYFCSDFKEPWWSCSNAWSTTWKQKSFIYKKDRLSIRGRQVNRSITSLWSNLEQRWNIYFELASLWNIIKYCSTFPEPILPKFWYRPWANCRSIVVYIFSIKALVLVIVYDQRSQIIVLLR